MKLEAWAVGITAGSREVPGRKGLWQETSISFNNNNNNNIYQLQLGCHPVAVVILHVNKTWNWLLLNLSREGYIRSMQWQLGILGTISTFAFRHRETNPMFIIALISTYFRRLTGFMSTLSAIRIWNTLKHSLSSSLMMVVAVNTYSTFSHFSHVFFECIILVYGQ